MAYRCPVCDVLQPDGEHLANHLAITAMLDREDHADWLAEHAPEYGDLGPAELAETVTPHAETVDTEDQAATLEESAHLDGAMTAGRDGESTRQEPFEHAVGRQTGQGRTGFCSQGSDFDAETRAVLEEARELTATMVDDEDAGVEGYESVTADAADSATETDGNGESESDSESGERTDASGTESEESS
jgi:hypothetical protein